MPRICDAVRIETSSPGGGSASLTWTENAEDPILALPRQMRTVKKTPDTSRPNPARSAQGKTLNTMLPFDTYNQI